MLTWAMAWFYSRPDIEGYHPLLFVVAMLCDATIAYYGALGFAGRNF